MQERMPSDLPPSEHLAWIHQRMADVTEEEVLIALAEDGSLDTRSLEGALRELRREREQSRGSASTPTV